MTVLNVVKAPKKLIEVALPLDAINMACINEASPFTPRHPRSLHVWWARRRLAAARAVIFGQMVNDPSWKWELENPGEIPPNNLKASWAASRRRKFAILEDLVKWENTTDEGVLEKARAEIRKSWRETCELNREHPLAAEQFNPENLPGLYDPFAGGGAIPLEAQRLGLQAFASDLNPVAVIINKSMIEIPSKFAGCPPVNANWQALSHEERLLRQPWIAAQGLAEDVRYYGQWMRREAIKRIGHHFPAVEITAEMAQDRSELKRFVGASLTVSAWIWARTVKSPNPAFHHVAVPLASTFILSCKEGKEAYIQPVVEGDSYRFVVKTGAPTTDAKSGTKLARGANFKCLISNVPIDGDYIKAEGKAGRIGVRLMAIVADGDQGRVYLSPSKDHETVAGNAAPEWRPETPLPDDPRNFWTVQYGLTTLGDLFTSRQLLALTTFSDLVAEVRERVRLDAVASGMIDDDRGLDAAGTGALAYSEAVAVYFGLAISRWTDLYSSLSAWNNTNQNIKNLFSRQAIPMAWDFAESNALGDGASFTSIVETIFKLFPSLPAAPRGQASQQDARSHSSGSQLLISTDPPYYDNINYADLSDFFYVWLRRSLKPIFPSLFATISVPKAEELIANPYRQGGKDKAQAYFLDGMTQVMQRLTQLAHPAFPVTIYYAFKQSESETETGTANTGWETFLDAVISSGFSISGTWPMRTERTVALKKNVNALASSIVLVCRPRGATATTISRRAFLRELNELLPEALDEMTKGAGGVQSPVAPVDLSQAIIGPGMAVFSKYAAVLEADGTPMTVRAALQLINRFLAEDDFDHDTQFCLHWFEQYGWEEGKFGDADTLARAKGTSVEGVKHGGVLSAAGGVVRLLKWVDYPADWDATTDIRLPVWEALHQLIRVFKTEGESGAGAVLAAVQAKSEATRQLAYRLYTLCERAGWSEDARAYNEIITSWSAIEAAATRVPGPKQTALFDA